jgi:hypothetical protein
VIEVLAFKNLRDLNLEFIINLDLDLELEFIYYDWLFQQFLMIRYLKVFKSN